MMPKALIFGAILTGLGSACSSPQEVRTPLHLQLKLVGTGLAKIQTQVYSRGKQKFLMFGDPAQEMRFMNNDTVDYVFPLGRNNAAGQLDTNAIARGEMLLLDFKIKANKLALAKAGTTQPLLYITLLANGKEMGGVKLPAANTTPGEAAAGDSTARLVLHTDSL